MELRGISRTILVVVAVGLAVLAGIGTAGSFGGDGTLWGDQYDPDSRAEGYADRNGAVLRAPAIRAAVDSVTGLYAEAVNAGEHGVVASLYAEDAVASRPGAPDVEGRSSIRSSLERAFPTGTVMKIDSSDVQVLSPEWASVWGRATAELAANADADRAGAERPMTFFALLRKTDGGWKVVREAVSSNR